MRTAMKRHPREEQLSEYIDGRLPPPRHCAVEAHLAGCAACRQQVMDLRLVRQTLATAPVPAASDGFWKRIYDRLATHDSSSSRKR